MQSVEYKHNNDLNDDTIFKSDRHNRMIHVHPLIHTLFSNKIDDVDERMILANIAEVVHDRYNKKPITTLPNYKLLYYLIHDPTDIVCSSASPMKDMLDRAQVQGQLWKVIHSMREGKYFENNNLELLGSLEACKKNPSDNPNMAMFGDEGVLLKRLFDIFAFRPITIQTMPVQGVNLSNNFNNTILNPVITSIPFIIVKPGIYFNDKKNEGKTRDMYLNDYITDNIDMVSFNNNNFL
jgi:hypothetical protein